MRLFFCTLTVCVLVSLQARGDHEARVWTSASGTTVNGAYAGHQGGTILLTLASGKEARVAFDRFCEADKERIREIVRAERAVSEPASGAAAAPVRTTPTVAKPKAADVTHELPFAYGKVSPEIKCDDAPTISYFIYSSETSSRKG